MFQKPESAGLARLAVVRVSPGHDVRAVSLGSQFLPVSCHWVGRSVPCCVVDCALCALLPARAWYYLPVDVDGRVSMLELSPTASASLEQHLKLLHGGMGPGHILLLRRRGLKHPVYAECVGRQEGVQEFSFHRFASLVMALYNLPPIGPSEEIDQYDARLRSIVSRRNVALAVSVRDRAAAAMRG